MTKPVAPQEHVTQFFNTYAPTYFDRYDARDQEGHSFRIRKQQTLDLLKNLPAGSHVADIGCGPGVMTAELLQRGFRVSAFDIAPEMIEECRKRFAGADQLTLGVAPAEHLPLEDRSVDVLIALGLVEYLKDDLAVLKEFARVLKPGGLVAVSLPHYASPARAWDRLTNAIAKPILRVLRGKGKLASGSGVIHREYRLAEYKKLMNEAGFAVTDEVFYNMKILLRPLHQWFPAAAAAISERFERFARTPVLRRLGTGVIMVGKKSS